MGNRIRTNQTALTLDRQILQGVDKHFAGVTSVTLAGVAYTPEALKAVFQEHIDVLQGIDTLRATIKERLMASRAAGTKVHALRKALARYLLGMHGETAVEALHDFGMEVPKSKSARTTEVMVNALARARATREARHTMGKKQKAAIKGKLPEAPSTPTPEE